MCARLTVLLPAAAVAMLLVATGCDGKGTGTSVDVQQNLDQWVALLSDPNVDKRVHGAWELSQRRTEELKPAVPKLEAAIKDQTDGRVKKLLQYAIDKGQGKQVGAPPMLPRPRR